jgi:hypothetical protein
MKIIITSETDCSDEEAIATISSVIAMGLISGEHTVRGKQYCYLTSFGEYMVSADKLKSGTHKFTIWKQKNKA